MARGEEALEPKAVSRGGALAPPREWKKLMKKVARISLRFAGWVATLAAVMVVLGVLALMVGPRVVGWQGLTIFTGSM